MIEKIFESAIKDKYGLIFTGKRHADIIKFRYRIIGLKSNGLEQGFMTNMNRYVSREEALDIAIKAGQVKEGFTISKNKLFSEDLY